MTTMLLREIKFKFFGEFILHVISQITVLRICYFEFGLDEILHLEATCTQSSAHAKDVHISSNRTCALI